MSPFIEKFMNHMAVAKNAGENTLLAYRRDLCKLEEYLLAAGNGAIETATTTALMAYILHMHRSGKHAATVSRCIAVMKHFYKYLFYERDIRHDPAHILRPPKISRQGVQKLSTSDMNKLLNADGEQSDTRTVRDRAIAALIAATGIHVGTLTELNLGDIDIAAGVICHRNDSLENAPKLDPDVRIMLEAYIHAARNEILYNAKTFENTDADAPLFVNMKGQRLTRQGLWKIIKAFGRRAQLECDLNPRLLGR